MLHPALAISEAAFQAQVIELAKLCGWRTYHTRDSRGSAAGFPDLVLLRGGCVVFAELKRERGRVTAPQREWIEALRAVPGLTVEVWRPADWQQIERVLTPRRNGA